MIDKMESSSADAKEQGIEGMLKMLEWMQQLMGQIKLP